VIDDEDAIRESLCLLLYSAGYQTRAYESADVFLAESPDREVSCMLLDIRMPGTDGMELFDVLRRQSVAYPIIFITGHGDIPLAVTAIQKGAYDFLTKPFMEGELLEKVDAAINDYRERSQKLLELADIRSRFDELTARERDVLVQLVEGLSNKRIADQLGISPRTVEIHRAHVMEKMQADSIAALVKMASALEDQ
jgi:FixJ family two-component response regulator